MLTQHIGTCQVSQTFPTVLGMGLGTRLELIPQDYTIKTLIPSIVYHEHETFSFVISLLKMSLGDRLCVIRKVGQVGEYTQMAI